MIKLAREDHTLRDLLNTAMDWGLSDEGVAEALRTYKAVKPSDPIGKMDEHLKFNQSRWLYDYLRAEASKEGVAYYAGFWAPDFETFAKIDPNEVDIVEAVVDTTAEETRYMKAEEEWRIPPQNILSLGPVSSQKGILEKMMVKRAAVVHQGSVYLFSPKQASNYYVEKTILDDIEGVQTDIDHYDDLWEHGRIDETTYYEKINELHSELEELRNPEN
jgi:hypothetical protein